MAYGGVEVQLHSFLTMAPDGGEQSATLSPGKEPLKPTEQTDGSQRQSGRFGEVINYCHCQESTTIPWAQHQSIRRKTNKIYHSQVPTQYIPKHGQAKSITVTTQHLHRQNVAVVFWLLLILPVHILDTQWYFTLKKMFQDSEIITMCSGKNLHKCGNTFFINLSQKWRKTC